MTTLSNEAFAVMAVCEETHQPFGITVDCTGPRRYRFVWPFRISEEQARREGYDRHTVTDSVTLDNCYPGCPHCGSRRFWLCACGKVVCWHGQPTVTCPCCGRTGELAATEEVELNGGGY